MKSADLWIASLCFASSFVDREMSSVRGCSLLDILSAMLLTSRDDASLVLMFSRV